MDYDAITPAEKLVHEMTNAENAALEYRIKQRDEALHEIEVLLLDMGIAPGTQLRIDGRKVYGTPTATVLPVAEPVEEAGPEPEPHENGRVLYPVGAE